MDFSDTTTLDELCNILSSEDIGYYLMKNPNFFKENPSILLHMNLQEPKSSRHNVISLHKEIIERAREEIKGLQKTHHSIEKSKSREQKFLFSFYELLKEIVFAPSLRTLSEIVIERTPYLLGVDFADVLIETQGKALQKRTIIEPFLRMIPPDTTRTFLEKKRSKIFHPAGSMPLLFRDRFSVYNACRVISLDNGIDFAQHGFKGLLVLASKNPQFFDSSDDESHIHFLADILAICLNKNINDTPSF